MNTQRHPMWCATLSLSALIGLAGIVAPAARADFASDMRARKAPVIPPRGQKLRVIIDTDAKNEIDDQWAIALAIFSPERFQIEGFVAATFMSGGHGAVEASAKELEVVLKKAGMAGRWPVKRGSDPLQYRDVPVASEGVDFIIEKAMASTPEDPLWIIGLGAATDLASAYLKEPRIANRIVAFWHFRTQWPKRCWNYNVFGDRHAAQVVFGSPIPFVLFDTGAHLQVPMEESARMVRPHGELGRYLHDYRKTNEAFVKPTKGMFDLGDIAALVDPDIAQWEVAPAPEVDWDLAYNFKGTNGELLRCKDIDRDKTFDLLYKKLASATRKKK